MAKILILGNKINAGDNGKVVQGFKLHDLLKLDEVEFSVSLLFHISMVTHIDFNTVYHSLASGQGI